jgi:hypothetical protein
MKVAIIGSRDFAMVPGSSTEGQEIFIRIAIAKLWHSDYIVSGGANGADFWGEFYARQCAVGRIIHEADWGLYGKSAGPIRNTLIVESADCVLAFFSNRVESRGTRNCVAQAKKKGIPVYEYDAATEMVPSWLDTWYDEMVGLSRISGDLSR